MCPQGSSFTGLIVNVQDHPSNTTTFLQVALLSIYPQGALLQDTKPSNLPQVHFFLLRQIKLSLGQLSFY